MRLILTCVVLFLSAPLPAQRLTQLSEDARTAATISDSSKPSFRARVGSYVLFRAWTLSRGTEMFSYDCNLSTVTALPEIWPGPISGDPITFFELAGKPHYVGTGPEGTRIWTSDGTVAGTKPIVSFRADIGAVHVRDVCVSGSKAYFFVDDFEHGTELWCWGGTMQRPALTRDVAPGVKDGVFQWVKPIQGGVVFQANDGVTGTELWFSDGTAAGTRLIKDLNSSVSWSFLCPFSFGGKLYFSRYDPAVNRNAIWVTDGTAQGTNVVTNRVTFPEWSTSAFPWVVLGSKFYFPGMDPNRQIELWASDGTDAGTQLVQDLEPGMSGCEISDMEPLTGGRFAIVAKNSAYGSELWISDGTTSGTKLLADLVPGGQSSSPAGVRAFGSGLLFSALSGTNGQELWFSDGTTTRFVQDLNPGAASGHPRAFDCGNGSALLAVTDSQIGRELWTTNGTSAGTKLHTDIAGPAPQGSSGVMPIDLTPSGENLVFSGHTSAEGREPWISDNTRSGTRLLRDVRPGPQGSDPGSYTFVEGIAYFTADDGVHGYELWASDGTPQGTVLLRDFSQGNSGTWQYGSPQVFGYGGRAWFIAPAGSAGRELWSSDGTVAGTKLAFDLEPGSADSAPYHLGTLRGRMLLAVSQSAHGRELWSSDGTAAGTSLLKDCAPGTASSLAYDGPAIVWGDRLWFSADDGQSGRELWTSDGTASGTSRFADLRSGPGSGNPKQFVATATHLYFVADDGIHGEELWVTDGTPSGTKLKHDLNQGSPGSTVRDAVALGQGIVFVATLSGTDLGPEPYFIAPNLAAPRLLLDVAPGPDLGVKSRLWSTEAHVYFIGQRWYGSTTHLYRTDGSAAGTVLVAELPGRSTMLAVSAGKAWLSIFDPVSGMELFRYAPRWAAVESTVPGCAPTGRPRLRSEVPRLGSTARIFGEGHPAGTFTFLCLGAAPRVPTSFAPGCALAFDPLALLILAPVPVAGGSFQVPMPIPNDSNLVGLRLAWQSIDMPATHPLQLWTSNGLHWYLGH